MADIITADLVALDATFGQTKDDVIIGLTQLVVDAGRATSPEGLARDVFAREAKTSRDRGRSPAGHRAQGDAAVDTAAEMAVSTHVNA